MKFVVRACSNVVLTAREKLGHVELHCTIQGIPEAVKALIIIRSCMPANAIKAATTHVKKRLKKQLELKVGYVELHRPDAMAHS